MKDNLKKVVVIGGGSGSSVALKGLKNYDIDITAIVTMFDSGGSTGILRDEFGYPSFGDLRQCLLALASDKNDKVSALKKVLDFRFDSKTYDWILDIYDTSINKTYSQIDWTSNIKPDDYNVLNE